MVLTVYIIKILEETVGKVTGYQSDDGILEHKAAINAVKELYKKQGEQKTTDKIEPKFKVGDWISGYYTNYKVMAINSKGPVTHVPVINLPFSQTVPCYAPDGICTNPQRDCINCPKTHGPYDQSTIITTTET